jgi:hypothetical protein
MTVEERLVRLEETVAALVARLDGVESPRARRESSPPPAPAPSPRGHLVILASRSTEWWLARGGAILTCFALILLYQYAVARNWITPFVRVIAGLLVGGILFAAGNRTRRRDDSSDVGMREVLLGAGLSAWYITAYAAAIFYALISVPTARIIFLALSLLGAWLSLRETRSILALLAIGAGFATPMLLPSDAPSIPAFTLYLATLAAIGLILYLMRGWQLVLWITFIAFWSSTGSATSIVCCADTSPDIHLTGSPAAARLSLAILISVAALAFMRVPALRRALLGTGSDLYTTPPRSDSIANFQRQTGLFVERITGREAGDDSLALWTLIVVTPLIALLHLSWTLVGAPLWQWGMIALIAAAVAWRLITSRRDSDSELSHVLAAGAALWSLVGVFTVGWGLAPYPLHSESVALMVASIHGLVTLELSHRSRYRVPRRIGLATALICIGTVLFSELILTTDLVAFDGQWVIAELASAALAAWIWWNRDNYRVGRAAKALGAGAYIALLFIDARVLGRVWQPLVTASYAIAGSALLVYARGPQGTTTMRRLGSITLVLVAGRLLLVDLARVETIWRVLLFLGCGALFLVTSHRLQSSSRAESA